MMFRNQSPKSPLAKRSILFLTLVLAIVFIVFFKSVAIVSTVSSQYQEQQKQGEEDRDAKQLKQANFLTAPPLRGYQETEEEKLINEKLNQEEKDKVIKLTWDEYNQELKILEHLDYDPGYASLPLIDYHVPKELGENERSNLDNYKWKLDKSTNALLLPKPHIFIHIPKCAGSSLSGIFKRNEKRELYDHHWKHPSFKQVQTITAKETIFGHIRYGLHFYYQQEMPHMIAEKQNGLNKYSYLTMLREPVDRVISHYYYHRQNRKDPFHKLAMEHSLKEWIAISPSANNEQARMICGLGDQSFGDNSTFDLAHHHLKYTFKYVGITERFPESLVLLSHYAGLQSIRYAKINTGRQRVGVKDVPEDVVEEIKKRNWIDVSLYNMALDIFEKEIDLVGRDYFNAEVESFVTKYHFKKATAYPYKKV
ncbi:hypothetical protein CYY_000016 [Polysphondylium violaceum]|uniref:Uncharacterized protein n=1 Tax=Polysphondylium violaceum TaxID=133409 RepID=A0A8J4V2R1_9MYCE|nr:hypothetical protein CYY_000016 [Polysphondylium violaceum]